MAVESAGSVPMLSVEVAADRAGLDESVVLGFIETGQVEGAVRLHDDGKWLVPENTVGSLRALGSQVKDRPQNGFKERVSRWWKPVAGLLTALVLVATAMGAVREEITPLLSESDPFAPSVEDEVLVVIARYGQASDEYGGLHTSIGERLEGEIERLGLDNVRVEYLGRTIDSENVEAEIRELETHFGASVVVWGERTDTAVRTRVHVLREFEVPVETSFDRCRLQTGACTNAEGALSVTQPLVSDFEFEVTSLPNQVIFVAFYVVARVANIGGDTEEAARLMETAIASENLGDRNGLSAAYSTLGYYRLILEEYESAIDALDRVIEIDPNNAFAFNNRGHAYAELEEFDKAIEDYDRAIELDPNNAGLFYDRGWIYAKLEEFDKAIEDYDRAIELDSKYALAFNNRGVAYAELEEFDKAIEDYDRAVELNSDYFPAFYNRGRLFYKQGDFDKALAEFDRAIELNPDSAVAFNNRGRTYHDLGEIDQAIADYNRALELDPDYLLALLNRTEARKESDKN